MESLTLKPASAIDTILALRDPRTKNWITLQNPMYIAALLGTYLYVAKSFGPRYMKNKQPYSVKRTVMAYNLFQVLANVYFLWRIFYHSFWAAGYSAYCQGLTYSADPHALSLLDSLYWYLWVRVADFMDTVFFIMKKKFSHISVLHVVHHTIVVFSGWMFMQFGADGQVVLGVCVNSFVHIIMYTYYFLACLGPSVQKYLWWKRYLTRLQIGQFVLLIAHAFIPIFVDCGYPPILLYIAIPQVALVLGLFINFYIQAYNSRKTAAAEKAANGHSKHPEENSSSAVSTDETANGTANKTASRTANDTAKKIA
ncbi:very long chain fatty acid elongase 7-like [Dermacentor andersoni]|uniref:very long chain fatty acid elongase 7-like n=1 Tax=Dermacentor andersoni TaxID=34620 RepID=UPI002155A5B9|nr:elongation of very long chain fatty acids protein 7-like [Dermacentor andersoni]